jgi:Tfp pilus assembly protein PilN
MSKIRINLLSEKKKKSIPIPVGGIVMALWVILNGAGLYYGTVWVEEEKETYREQKGIDRLEMQVRKLSGDFKRKKQMEQELNSVEAALSDYQGILSKRMGSWTKILHRFEEFLARSKSVWVTQLRIDEDGQVQLNGVSMEALTKQKDPTGKSISLTTKGITDLVNILRRETDFVRGVSLSQITNDVQDKKPVAKFDLTFVIDKNI